MAKSAKPDKKKLAKKKAAKKKIANKSAGKSAPSRALRAAPPLPGTGNCTCMKFGKFYFCMVEKPDGSFERCPTLTRFRTLEECQQNSC